MKLSLIVVLILVLGGIGVVKISRKKTIDPKLKINTAKEKANLWDLNNVIWYTGDREVRVVWADRKVLEKEKNNQDDFIWADKRRVFAFSKKIDHIPVKTVYNIGIHR